MKLLTFDTECANNYNNSAKVCSFGYVVSDDAFNVIEKRDILINPQSHFHPAMLLKGGIQFAYTQTQFDSAPSFKDVYPDLKQLLEAPDTLIVGHSVGNDNLFLVQACRRAKVTPFDYQYIDAQIFYSVHTKNTHIISLDKIASKFNIDFVAHRSDEDAFATMYYLKKICEEEQKTLSQLMFAYGVTPGHVTCDGEIFPMHCSTYIEPQITDAMFVYRKLLRTNRAAVDNGPFRGLIFCFNLNLERNQPKLACKLIHKINNLGGSVVSDVRKCTTLIYDVGQPCARCRKSDHLAPNGHNPERWSYPYLCKKLNIDSLNDLLETR